MSSTITASGHMRYNPGIQRAWTWRKREETSNQVAANNGGQGYGNQGNQARVGPFPDSCLGAEELAKDSNIVTELGGLANNNLGSVVPLFACFPHVREFGALGGMGERVGRGGGRVRGPREGNDERVNELNGQGNDQGLGAKGGVEGVNGNVEEVNGGVESTRLLDDHFPAITEPLTRHASSDLYAKQEGKLEYWKICMVGASHAAYTDRFHELARLVPYLVTPKSRKIQMYVYGLAPHIRGIVAAMEPKTIQKAGRGNQGNQARGRAFMLGAEEARQDSNIVTGTFTLNNHFATTLFDFDADYIFVSATFIPLLGIEPSELGFRYEIEIASGQLVEIGKVIKGCKLEIEGHVFDIDLIPFGHGSF
ncbi:hypothetical protein Tco_0834031 [Tanacetum coccineum]